MNRFKNILVATDTRLERHPIVDEAAEIARSSGAALKIIDVLPDFPWTVRLSLRDSEHYRDLLAAEMDEKLKAVAAPLQAAGTNVTTKVLAGSNSIAIVREVLQFGHDLVMRVAKGSHSRRPGFFGTTGIRLLRKCPCPVWLVSPETTPEFKHVMACVDTHSTDPEHIELNRSVVDLAKSISEYKEGRYSVVHAWSIWGEEMFRTRMETDEFAEYERTSREQAAKTLDGFIESVGITSGDDNVHLLKGDASVVIPEFARDNGVDLVVMGTIGRSGVTGLLMGNTAELILSRISCSVVALKPAGFVSPVKVAV